MSLDEAIKHLEDILTNNGWECEECKQEHIQFKEWLMELRDVRAFLSGEWVESEKVQKALGMSFNECFSKFDFSRTAEWWSIVGKTEEERARNGQKITTCFRLKKGGIL